MKPPAHNDGSDDPQRHKLLRSLHPARARRSTRRWRWIRAALALALTVVLSVALNVAHQAALRATSDSDPGLGLMLCVGGLFVLSLVVFVALLGIAIASDLAGRGHGGP